MTDEGQPRRRWLLYEATGQQKRWYKQPLYWGLLYLSAGFATQTIAAIYWTNHGSSWFGSAAGQQAPVLLVLVVALAAVGLGRLGRRGR